MKNKLKLFGVYLPIFILILVATVTMRSIALFNDFNLITGYFDQKTLISVADYIVVGAVIFFLTYLFTARKGIKLIPDFTSPATYIPSGLVMTALLFFTVYFARSISGRVDYAKYLDKIGSSDEAVTQKIIVALMIALILLAVLTAAHFALNSLIESYASYERGHLSLCTAVFLAVYSIYLYFNDDLPMNSPAKVLDLMACLFAALFILYETRLSIGRERWRCYVAFGFIASLITAYDSIPSLLLYFVKGEQISMSVYEMVLYFTLFAFITSRILLTGWLIEDETSPFAKAVAAASDARDNELNPIPDAAEVIDVQAEPETEETATVNEDDANQITIDDIRIEEAMPTEADVMMVDEKTTPDAAPAAEANEVTE